MVLTEEVQKDIYPIASLENTNAVLIENSFYRIDGVNILDRSAALDIPPYDNNNGIPINNTVVNANDNSQRLYRLNGNAATKMGLGITLKVMAGDEVQIFGKSYWKSGAGLPTGTNSVAVLDLLKDFVGSGLPGGKTGVSGDQLNALVDITGGITSLLGGQSQTETQPKAFINWVLFDENFRPVISSESNPHTNSGFDQVGENGQLISHNKSTGEITKNGYLYVYCSNETKLDVFFDNLQVVHTRGALLEETHYYPFGLAMAGISSKAISFGGPENKKKYNGIEFENDLDLNTYDAYYRELDPQTGRWWEIDPEIENMEAWSPYASNYDNPITYSDPLGDEPDGDDPDPPKKGFFRGMLDRAKDLVVGGLKIASGYSIIETSQNAMHAGKDASQGNFQTLLDTEPTGFVGLGKTAIAAANGDKSAQGSLVVDVIVVLVLHKASKGKIAETKTPEVKVDKPYQRPSGATTSEQRAAVQGQPCVKCGGTSKPMVAGHKKALVKEYYQTGKIDKKKMKSKDAVQPECTTCSAKEGAEMSKYSKEQKKKNGL